MKTDEPKERTCFVSVEEMGKRITALEAENVATKELLSDVLDDVASIERHACVGARHFREKGEDWGDQADKALAEVRQKCMNIMSEAMTAMTALSPPTGKVLVDREKLEDLRDLARTGTPPASYGLGDDAWAKCRLHGIAGKLAALLKD